MLATKTKSKREGFPKSEFKEADHGTAICKKCKSVHMNKRWFFDEKKYKELAALKNVFETVCLGCQMVEKKHIDGLVSLSSPKVKSKKEEFISKIKHEAAREFEKNSISRIVSLEHKGENIVVCTTTQFLAARIGRAVDKAYKGELVIQKLQREKFVRVNWVGW